MLTERDVLAHCTAEIQASTLTGELSDERTQAMEYYLGEPYGDEEDERSQVVTREVLETVEWVIPSLMRIFMDAENVCSFDAVGPEDEDAAQQESDVCSHVFWKKTNGFYNLLSAIKDGLLSKTGWLKIWYDDSEREEREEYAGVDLVTINMLLMEEGVSREILSADTNDDGSYDLVMMATYEDGKINIMPCAPEDIGVNRDAYSPNIDDCRFVYHQVRRSRSDLIEEGFDPELVNKIPSGDDVQDEERLARRHLTDEQDIFYGGSHQATQPVWVTECYIKLDRDEDGIAEMLKVVIGGAVSVGSSGGSGLVLSIDEVDRFPFAAWTPVMLTHKFIGLSLADLVKDLQYIQSTLTRNMLDNVYLINNTEKAVNERVNLEDMLKSQPGGMKRVEGYDPVSGAIEALPTQPLPPESFGLLEKLDEMRKGRTGVGSDVAALDPASLSNVNTGVAALAYDASRARIELIAWMCAEFLIKPTICQIHELLSKNHPGKLAVKLNNEWLSVHPSEWRNRTDVSVNVGIGKASNDRRLLAMQDVLMKQTEAVAGGGLGTVLTPENLYNAVSDYTKLLGEDPTRYWTDPATIPPPEPQPNPQLMALQAQAEIEQGKLQLQARKQQLDELKLKMDVEARVVENSIKQRQIDSKMDVEQLKAELAVQKTAIDEQSQIMNAQANILAKETDIALREQDARMKAEIEEKKFYLEARAQEIEQYKAELASATQLVTSMQSKLEKISQRAAVDAMESQELKDDIVGKLGEMIKDLNAPIEIERDQNGDITRIGGVDVETYEEEQREHAGLLGEGMPGSEGPEVEET